MDEQVPAFAQAIAESVRRVTARSSQISFCLKNFPRCHGCSLAVIDNLIEGICQKWNMERLARDHLAPSCLPVFGALIQLQQFISMTGPRDVDKGTTFPIPNLASLIDGADQHPEDDLLGHLAAYDYRFSVKATVNERVESLAELLVGPPSKWVHQMLQAIRTNKLSALVYRVSLRWTQDRSPPASLMVSLGRRVNLPTHDLAAAEVRNRVRDEPCPG